MSKDSVPCVVCFDQSKCFLCFNMQAVLMSKYCTNCQSYCLPLHSGVFKSESRELVDKETFLTFSDVLYMCKKNIRLFYFEIVLYIQEHFLIHSQLNNLFSFTATSFVDFIFSLTPYGAAL